MKKFILFFLLNVSFFIFANNHIKISNTTVKQGGFFYVEFPSDKDYEISFQLSSDIKQFERDGFKYAFIPVHYSNAVGKYPIKIIEKGEIIYSSDINLEDGNFKKSYITVNKKMEKKRSPENMKKGADLIGEAKKNPSNKLWKGKFIHPVEKKISSPFGAMRFVNNKVVGYHSGIDYPVPIGTPLKATNDGKVVFAGQLPSTGYTLVIDHGMNVYSSYSHMSSFNVKSGQMVKKGENVGKSGNTGFTTGPHLHFTIAIGKTFVNPYLFINNTVLEKNNSK
ncbi:M23 family metallopeptidase [Fusobacterium sp. PH5-44]|uniref:M23 family metallopeptidase n=1 Tax=unclassified Fusobacterium TaxID=2648384 RepID=UPI003D1FA893